MSRADGGWWVVVPEVEEVETLRVAHRRFTSTYFTALSKRNNAVDYVP